MSSLCLPTDYPVGRDSVSMREGKEKEISRKGWNKGGGKEGRGKGREGWNKGGGKEGRDGRRRGKPEVSAYPAWVHATLKSLCVCPQSYGLI